MLTLFLKNSQDYVVKLSHFGQLKPKKSPELLSYCGQKPLLHSWVLGIDNLAKWQNKLLQLKRFGNFSAINL
jgi:hypothetical protein